MLKVKKFLIVLGACIIACSLAGCTQKEVESTVTESSSIQESQNYKTVSSVSTRVTRKNSTTRKSQGNSLQTGKSTKKRSTIKNNTKKTTKKKSSTSKNTAGRKSTGRQKTTDKKSTSSENKEKKYTLTALKNLKHSDIFTSSAIEHIFEGQINSKGEAVGYHYDQIEGTPGKIVSGTKSSLDSHGVYKGKVEVSGTTKTGNRGYSTFYPDNMSPQQVVDGIYTAYQQRVYKTGNIYYGYTSKGIKITMYLNDDNKIISAFPEYNAR